MAGPVSLQVRLNSHGNITVSLIAQCTRANYSSWSFFWLILDLSFLFELSQNALPLVRHALHQCPTACARC